MRNLNCLVLNHSNTESSRGAAIDSNQLVSASFQIVLGDASANGIVTIQASNDIYNDRYNYPEGTFTPTNWTDIPTARAIVGLGSGPFLVLPNLVYRWIRAVYTKSSGGSSTISINMDAISR